jgi:protocatechuate 3,4-dioxygenase beta subunit
MAQLASDIATAIDRRRVLGGLAAGMGGLMLASSGQRARAQGDACTLTPTETRGPFPADGTNGSPRISVLRSQAVIRDDIRTSFAGLRGTAEGVPLELNLKLIGATNCQPLAGHALYLWHNDAAGAYSLYALPEANYLRGLQIANSAGELSFTTIVPGCYGGRYPHCHFEVYAAAAPALDGKPPLLVSQLAFPDAECRAVYRADRRYGDSLQNLAQLPITRDFVFADSSPAGRARQTIVLTGDPIGGYRGSATIAL